MFDDLASVRRIEEAEGWLTRALVEAVIASGHAPRAFLRKYGAAVAAYVRPNSPLNKVIGLGFAGAIEETELEKVEALMRARREMTRLELSTTVPHEVSSWLLERGYRLLGHENVLVRSLRGANDAVPPEVEIELVNGESTDLWRRTTIEATAESDHTGHPVDQFARDTIVDAVNDFLRAPGFERYLARLNGSPVGAASMRIWDRVALLCGSATVPGCRRRGVQTGLIAARLAAACDRGAELAVVTTAPASRSEANMIRVGFSVAYSRAILVRE